MAGERHIQLGTLLIDHRETFDHRVPNSHFTLELGRAWASVTSVYFTSSSQFRERNSIPVCSCVRHDVDMTGNADNSDRGAFGLTARRMARGDHPFGQLKPLRPSFGPVL